MRTKTFNSEVLYPDQPFVAVDRDEIISLKASAKANPRRRIRLCTHRDIADTVHEMLIVHARDTYVRPHKHLNRGESFHVIEGSATAVFFDDVGSLLNVVRLGEFSTGASFYYRLDDPLYHTLLIDSPQFVFHETTNGPFRPDETVFAPWSPADGGPEVSSFMAKLLLGVEKFRTKNP